MIVFKIRLKSKRLSLGLTQEELGKNVFLSKGEICAYEKGKRIPPLDVLIRIAAFLEVDFLWLIGLEKRCNIEKGKVVNLSQDDLNIINTLKKNTVLYEMLLDNPDRILSQLNHIFK